MNNTDRNSWIASNYDPDDWFDPDHLDSRNVKPCPKCASLLELSIGGEHGELGEWRCLACDYVEEDNL